MNEEKKTMQDLMGAAKKAESAEELLNMAKENGIMLEEDRAKELFDSWHGARELSDDELDNVAGGCDDGLPGCPRCGGYNYHIVDENAGFDQETATCYDCGHKWNVRVDPDTKCYIGW